MLDLKNISLQFDEKLNSIKSYDSTRSELIKDYRNELEKLKNIDLTMNRLLPPYSGAKLFETGSLIRPFTFKWDSRHDAIKWVDTVLSGIGVGAVDGSQIYSDKNYEIPLAVIQTSRIFNRHTCDSDYSQKTEALLITSDEFEKANVYSFGSEYIDARRFLMECESIIKLMKEHENIYILLDGALILSHINMLNRNIKNIYINAIIKLLETSENTKTPVIGFIDTSISHDVTLMMRFMFNLKKSKLWDTHLFSSLSWGERTATFLCDKDDRRGDESISVLDNYGKFKNEIAFFYMKVGNGNPSRIEFPLWAYDKVDKIADIIRAQCIIRGNYPDILMRAHEAALIKMNEHILFYKMLENFCKIHDIKINKSAKNIHKIYSSLKC